MNHHFLTERRRENWLSGSFKQTPNCLRLNLNECESRVLNLSHSSPDWRRFHAFKATQDESRSLWLCRRPATKPRRLDSSSSPVICSPCLFLLSFCLFLFTSLLLHLLHSLSLLTCTPLVPLLTSLTDLPLLTPFLLFCLSTFSFSSLSLHFLLSDLLSSSHFLLLSCPFSSLFFFSLPLSYMPSLFTFSSSYSPFSPPLHSSSPRLSVLLSHSLPLVTFPSLLLVLLSSEVTPLGYVGDESFSKLTQVHREPERPRPGSPFSLRHTLTLTCSGTHSLTDTHWVSYHPRVPTDIFSLPTRHSHPDAPQEIGTRSSAV